MTSDRPLPSVLMHPAGSFDTEVRSAAFEYVARLTDDGDRPISWQDLSSFSYRGESVFLASTQGIFKPRQLALPISIRTAPPGDGPAPYADEVTEDGYLSYAYRGTDPGHYQNEWLRRAMEGGVALLYLRGIATGIYDASGAAIIDDDRGSLRFRVALMPLVSVVAGLSVHDIDATQRRYYLRLTNQRAHQAAFRSRVLHAYRTSCAVCRLRHAELLDAAHIISDREGGRPVIPNGLSLCKIHHAAFDANILGVRPDLKAEIRHDVLEEIDGPMLRYGLQAVHGEKLIVPRRAEWRPDAAAIEKRYDRFREAS